MVIFTSNWLGLEPTDTPNPHVYTGNFMNGNNDQPQTANDFENIGQAMDIVDEAMNELQTENLTQKPTVKSAQSKAPSGSATGGN